MRKSTRAVSLALILLVVTLPFAAAQNMSTNATAPALFLDVNLPSIITTSYIDVSGVSTAGADIQLLINNVSIRTVASDGSFTFPTAAVPPGLFSLAVVANLSGQVVERSFNIVSDVSNPVLTVVVPDMTTSSPISATVSVDEPVTLYIDVNDDNSSQSLMPGEHLVSVSLDEGNNTIRFRAVDASNRSSLVIKNVLFDSTPPVFESTNLEDMEVSYQADVDVRGVMSEPSAITLVLNGKAKKTVNTKEDDSFRIPFDLERNIEIDTSASAVGLETGTSWKNDVKLIAVDAVGLNSSISGEIDYGICGEGTWFDVSSTESMPSALTPRLILEGLQQVGVGFTYAYRGADPNVEVRVNPNSIEADLLQFSPEFADEWDNDLVESVDTLVSRPRVSEGAVEGDGYVQLNIKPWDPLNDPEAATYDREKAISDHRRSATTAGGGQMKFYLILEIPFSETRTVESYDPALGRTVLEEETTNRVQKTCIRFSVLIDERIPNFLPSSFFRKTSQFFSDSIELIDEVLDPIKTIGEYLFYTCFAGTFLMYIPVVREKVSCEFSSFATTIGGQGFSVDVAEIGACEATYSGERLDHCQSCADAKMTRKKLEKTYREVCDRTMCVAPPTLQSYIKDKARLPLRAISVPSEVVAEFPSAYSKDGKLYAGSDCAAFAKEHENNPTSVQNIRTVFADYLREKNEEKCSGPHPATPDCCGYEYMYEWSSACGTSVFGDDIDTFDEIKESACYSAQKAGVNTIDVGAAAPVECNKVFNAVSGFCSPEGTQAIEPIRVNRFSDELIEDLGLDEFGKERFLYLFVIPPENGEQYDLKLGYLVERLQFERSEEALAVTQRHYFTADLEAVELTPQPDVHQYFDEGKLSEYYKNPDGLATVYNQFSSMLSDASGSGVSVVEARQIYDKVVGVIGEPDKEYIVKPDEGIFNAIRCLCFPTIIKYLELVKKVLQVIKNCSDTIERTGDGSPGMCEAALSRYVCDLLYEAIRCFAEKYNTGSPFNRIGTTDLGIGEGMPDYFGAITSAGSELSRSVTSRYGEASLYKSIFVEKQLVHSACMFVFTGDFEFDFAAAFDTALEDVPVESISALYPCRRKFLGPSLGDFRGYSNWVYDFGIGVFPGSDLELELQLKCSGDYSCSEQNGYENGECDCARSGERIVTIRPEGFPTSLKSTDPALDTQIFYTMMGNARDGSVRYDRAVLKYYWKDSEGRSQTGESVCEIDQVGEIPAFCSFNPFSLQFECSLGEQGTGIAFAELDTDGPHPVNARDTYALEEPMNFSLRVQQEYPNEPDRSADKHLVFQIFNQDGDSVADNEDNPFQLNTRGEYSWKIVDKAPGLRLTEEWFGVATGSDEYTTRSWDSLDERRVVPGDAYIDDVTVTYAGSPISDNRVFVLEIKQDGPRKYYSLYKGSSAGRLGENGFLDPSDAVLVEDVPYSGTRIMWSPDTVMDDWTPSETLQIFLKYDPVLDDGESVQIHINYNPDQTLNPCEGTDEEKARPQRFRVKFTAYDSDSFGKPTDIISVDYNGRPAEIEENFYASCVNASVLEPLEEEDITQPENESEIDVDALMSDITSFFEYVVDAANSTKNDADYYVSELNASPYYNEWFYKLFIFNVKDTFNQSLVYCQDLSYNASEAGIDNYYMLAFSLALDNFVFELGLIEDDVYVAYDTLSNTSLTNALAGSATEIQELAEGLQKNAQHILEDLRPVSPSGPAGPAIEFTNSYGRNLSSNISFLISGLEELAKNLSIDIQWIKNPNYYYQWVTWFCDIFYQRSIDFVSEWNRGFYDILKSGDYQALEAAKVYDLKDAAVQLERNLSLYYNASRNINDRFADDNITFAQAGSSTQQILLDMQRLLNETLNDANMVNSAVILMTSSRKVVVSPPSILPAASWVPLPPEFDESVDRSVRVWLGSLINRLDALEQALEGLDASTPVFQASARQIIETYWTSYVDPFEALLIGFDFDDNNTVLKQTGVFDLKQSLVEFENFVSFSFSEMLGYSNWGNFDEIDARIDGIIPQIPRLRDEAQAVLDAIPEPPQLPANYDALKPELQQEFDGLLDILTRLDTSLNVDPSDLAFSTGMFDLTFELMSKISEIGLLTENNNVDEYLNYYGLAQLLITGLDTAKAIEDIVDDIEQAKTDLGSGAINQNRYDTIIDNSILVMKNRISWLKTYTENFKQGHID